MRRVAVVMAVPMLMLAGVGGAAAQSKAGVSSGYYSCRDANGRLITADRPIMECLNREQKEHNSDGTVRRVIEAPLTPAQKAQRAEEDKRKAEREAALLEQRRKDRMLLTNYSTANDIDKARQRALDKVDASIASVRERLTLLQRDRQALEEDKKFYRKRSLPEALEQKILDNDALQRSEMAIMERWEQEIVRINTRFEAERKRFLELTSEPPLTR